MNMIAVFSSSVLLYFSRIAIHKLIINFYIEQQKYITLGLPLLTDNKQIKLCSF